MKYCLEWDQLFKRHFSSLVLLLCGSELSWRWEELNHDLIWGPPRQTVYYYYVVIDSDLLKNFLKKIWGDTTGVGLPQCYHSVITVLQHCYHGVSLSILISGVATTDSIGLEGSLVRRGEHSRSAVSGQAGPVLYLVSAGSGWRLL